MFSPITKELVGAYPADAARVLEEAATEVAAEALGGLPPPVAAAVLQAMTPYTAAGALAHLAPDAGGSIVRHLPTALASALLLHLDTPQRGALLKALPPRVSVPLRMLLRFSPDSVGSLIDPRVVTVRTETRIGEAAEAARRAPSLLRKYIYVLDEAQRLTGMVDARQCLVQDPTRPIGRLGPEEPVALRARTSLREASRHPGWERFSVLPATDHRGVFLGVVRRTSLRRALVDRSAVEPEGEVELTGLTLDLVDLYWQAAASIVAGAPTTDGRDEDDPQMDRGSGS